MPIVLQYINTKLQIIIFYGIGLIMTFGLFKLLFISLRLDE